MRNNYYDTDTRANDNAHISIPVLDKRRRVMVSVEVTVPDVQSGGWSHLRLKRNSEVVAEVACPTNHTSATKVVYMTYNGFIEANEQVSFHSERAMDGESPSMKTTSNNIQVFAGEP